MSIKLKLTFFVFFLLISVVIGISINIFLVQKQITQEHLEKNREKIFDNFVFTCREALIVKDEILVINTIKSVIETHTPQIVYAGYISPNDLIFLQAHDKTREEEFRHRILHLKGNSNEFFLTTHNEVIYELGSHLKDTEGNYLGSIKIGFSQAFLENEIKIATSLIAKRILNISILATVISLFLANILAIFFIKPIKKLTNAAIELGSGNLDVKIDIKRKDEIGVLAKTFNEMAEKLKQLDELKDSFVSSVSHELRSPLSAIDGYVDYLTEGLGTLSLEKQQKALSIIKDSVNRLITFINNILDLAKIKAGRYEIVKTLVEVKTIIKEVISLFEQMVIKQEKELEVEIQDGLPPIYADPEKIKQVIINLLGNALKFTDKNAKIKIKTALVTKETLSSLSYRKIYRERPRIIANDFVEISVSDTGCGIPENELNKIFEKFYQVGGTTSKKPKGTGLGLSISAEIIKLHNGSIGVESSLGKGSTFRFIIPVFKPQKQSII